MVLQSEPVLFYAWIGPALLFFFQVAAILGLLPGDIAWVSSAKGTGIVELRQEVAGLLDL